jgi:hypothetical protein
MLEVLAMVTLFRRKVGWLGVLLLILAFGLLVAGVLFAVDALGIGQSTATAYVTFVEPKWTRGAAGGSTSHEEIFQTFKATQTKEVNCESVLIEALRRPEVLKLQSVLEAWKADDPVDWLERRVSVTFPDNGWTMAVSLRCRHPREAAILVNAVVDAYFDEVVKAELPMKEFMLESLDRAVEEERHESASAKKARQAKEKEEAEQLVAELGMEDRLAARAGMPVVPEDKAGMRDRERDEVRILRHITVRHAEVR